MAAKRQKVQKRTNRTKSKKKRDDKARIHNAESDPPFVLKEKHFLALTVLAAAVYFVYSFISEGFYQHDEAGHFINMRSFWHNPTDILSIWAKPGFKLFFVIPSLLGSQAVLIVNCVVAALCCYLAVKIAQLAGFKTPVLAFLMLFLQPFWLELSFRNYSEILTAFFLLLAVHFYYRERFWAAALVLSYTATIRQEMYTLIAVYGLYLLIRKQILPILCLTVFPLLNNLWGWITSGDPIFLYNQMFGAVETIQGAYPSMGFLHYPRMSLTVFGALALVFFLVYLGQALFYKQKVDWPILVPLAVYFLQYCIFQIRSMEIGPSGAGNLRNLVAVSPLVAILAGLGADRLSDLPDRKKLLGLLAPFGLVVLIYLRYKHNHLTLLRQADCKPVLTTLIAVAGVYLPLRKREMTGFVAACAVVFVLVTAQPLKQSAENRAVKQAVDWASASSVIDRPMLANHTMFFYFLGKTRYDFSPAVERITQTAVADAPAGAVILWDSHYSYRPNLHHEQVPYTYFTERPEQFRQLHQPFITPDQRFGILVFEKLSATNEE